MGFRSDHNFIYISLGGQTGANIDGVTGDAAAALANIPNVGCHQSGVDSE